MVGVPDSQTIDNEEGKSLYTQNVTGCIVIAIASEEKLSLLHFQPTHDIDDFIFELKKALSKHITNITIYYNSNISEKDLNKMKEDLNKMLNTDNKTKKITYSKIKHYQGGKDSGNNYMITYPDKVYNFKKRLFWNLYFTNILDIFFSFYYL